ncbi:TlpA family protein disulfide reductase [Rubripirellula tenax]|uniref:TlpA family protein disulfide reductase n=1 Tax=Rubripirellula tenax TaxID=2528015 RepID=UPI001C94954A|nr:TlpA disulfide reductase family protein [Rubripirellula tenax]
MSQSVDLLIEQGRIDQIERQVERSLDDGNINGSEWIVRKLATTGHTDAVERLQSHVKRAYDKQGSVKSKSSEAIWDYRKFLAISALTAYNSGERDLCYELFLKLDRNWMSPSFVSRVAHKARENGDMEFLRRMESSPSPLMREAALASLAMHHVDKSDVEAIKETAATFEREFGKNNKHWSIYRRITDDRSVKDPSKRFVATTIAMQRVPMDSPHYAPIARDHAKLLGQLHPDKPLPEDWLGKLNSDPKLKLHVELEHAAGVGLVAAKPQVVEEVAATVDEQSSLDRPKPDLKAQRLGEQVHQRIAAISAFPAFLISTRQSKSYYSNPKGVLGLKDERSLKHLRSAIAVRKFDESVSDMTQTWAWKDKTVVAIDRHKYVYEGEPYDKPSARTWDGQRGWYQDSTGQFARYRSFSDTFKNHYFRPCSFLYLGDHRFTWADVEDYPNFFVGSTVAVKYADYQSLPDEDFEGEPCFVIRSFPREEQLWISQRSGKLVGHVLFISSGIRKRIHQMESLRRMAGQTFETRDAAMHWIEEVASDDQRRQVFADWFDLHRNNQHPHSLTIFQDYREVASGIELPHVEWRSDWSHEGKRYKYNVARLEVTQVTTQPELTPLIEQALPNKGDTINDWRFSTPVKYEFDPEMPESRIHDMVDKAQSKRMENQRSLDRILQPLKAMVGQKAPKLAGRPMTGGQLPKIGSGSRTLLYFWALWCGPCKNDIPTLNRLSKNGLNVIAVHAPGTQPEKIKAAIKETGMEYSVILGAETKRNGFEPSKITGYPIEMFPCCVSIDKDGNIEAIGSLVDVMRSSD